MKNFYWIQSSSTPVFCAQPEPKMYMYCMYYDVNKDQRESEMSNKRLWSRVSPDIKKQGFRANPKKKKGNCGWVGVVSVVFEGTKKVS